VLRGDVSLIGAALRLIMYVFYVMPDPRPDEPKLLITQCGILLKIPLHGVVAGIA
jgi:hypothetical protein